MRSITAVPALLLVFSLGLPTAAAQEKPLTGLAVPAPADGAPWAPLVAEAAARFAVPDAWLRAILAAESGGDPAAVSPAGAMGLMQLMPATWRALSRTYGLGDDPFAPRANILAGAAYLRMLRDRYGSPGFLAAYNAGPGRYEAYRRGLRPLPAETLRYVARLSVRLALSGDLGAPVRAGQDEHAAMPDWRDAPLFFSPRPLGETDRSTDPANVDALAMPPRDSLFPRQLRNERP